MVELAVVVLMVCVEPEIKIENSPEIKPVEVLVLPGDPELPELDYCGYNTRGQRVCCP